MSKASSIFDIAADVIKSAQTRMARARDTNYTTDTFHGSTHDLTEMDASKTNVEGDWGQGIYSSSNIGDVNENYAGVGPDLTARIEQQKDRLKDDILDEIETNGLETTLQRYSELLNDSVSTKFINDIEKYRDNDQGFAEDLADIVARKQIKGSNDGVVYPLKQNTEGFATIGGKDRTIVEGRDYHAEAREEIQRSDYDGEYDYEDAVEEYAFDLMNSDYDTNYQKVLEVIDKRGGGVSVDDLADAFEGDSVDLTKLDEIIRNAEIYAEDAAGNFIPNGAVSAEILQNLGFKGVIDNTANAKFGSARDRGRPMDGMDEDTVHYITFEGAENQIRSRNAQFKDPTSKNILAGSAATAVGVGTVLAPQDAEAGFFSQAVKAAGNLQRKTGNADGFKNDLIGKGQVKPDELKAMGFDEHFGGRKDITKEEVQQFINDNQVQIKETRLGISQEYAVRPDPDEGFIVYNSTNGNHISSHATQEIAADKALDLNVNSDNSKFGDYTLEGGDNYRELLLSNPRKPHADQGKLDDLRRSQDSEDYLSDLDAPRDKFLSEYRAVDSELNDLLWSEGGADLTGDKLAKSKQLKRQKWDANFKLWEVNTARDQRKMDLREQIVDLQHEIGQEKRGQEFVNAGHFDEPNILAHLRMKDRVDADGNKTLLIEEAQSDWHQTGADVGYKGGSEAISEATRKVNEANIASNKAEQEMADYFKRNGLDMESEVLDTDLYLNLLETDEASKIMDGQADRMSNVDAANRNLVDVEKAARTGVPDAPFKTDDKSSWYNLAMKRGLLEAAEGDYDKLAFTTGRQQADRYDLSKQINEVRLGGNERDGFTVSAFDKNNTPVIMESIESLDELPNLIGKDAAKSLVDQPLTDTVSGSARVLAGQDLSVGGEGMKQFYDRTLPNTLNKLVKQDGQKVGTSFLPRELQSMEGEFNYEGFTPDEVLDIRNLQAGRNYPMVDHTPEQAQRLENLLAREIPEGDTVHSIDITPEMRDRVKKGLPLFAQGGLAVGAGALFSPGKAHANTKSDEKNYDAIYAERDARAKMSPRERKHAPRASQALRDHDLSTMLPALGNVVQGAVRDSAATLDYVHPANLARLMLDPGKEGLSRFVSKPITNMYKEAVSPIVNPILYDEEDPEAKERAEKLKDFGGFFGL